MENEMAAASWGLGFPLNPKPEKVGKVGMDPYRGPHITSSSRVVSI